MKNRIEILGETAIIHLTHKGKELKTIIDSEDLEKIDVGDITWKCTLSPNKRYYVRTSRRKGKTRNVIHLHRLITNAPPGIVVDHINHDPLDNRKENLRFVTLAQNLQNIERTRSKSGHLGVSKHKSGKWQVSLKVNKKSIYIGLFDDLEVAASESKKARAKYLPYSHEAFIQKLGAEVIA